ncbi:Phosphoribulokinase/uridine kinase [Cynara cardunculus var. scolymus]|uniref:Phosphoribulokinase/uridine kinase n=1 Tax=Cynara cardunculus var. scolymus TaxID=59895 RepID=A0A103Y7E8_CYNCS|nr:Phosphoribulokinase/uridine kinase [Cynara cardunculus var. scolymus]
MMEISSFSTSSRRCWLPSSASGVMQPEERNSYSRGLVSMDEVYDTLAERVVPTAASGTNTSMTHIVGLAGPPGAGKTTVASEIAKRVNKIWPQKSCSFDSQVEPPEIAVVLPMDGFHLYRHQLDSMEDPKEAHARRGAPWTFNPDLLLKCLKTLRNQGSVYAPSFDHGVGDPVEDDIFIKYNDRPNAELVLKSKKHADLIIKSVSL